MEDERSHMTERILNLTLEIIYLLTGEECIIVKQPSDDHLTRLSQKWRRIQSSMTEPPSYSLISEINNDKKILEITKRITELLTGEVPIRSQDVTVYFSMEEWEYLEGHKDLYKDVMMEKRPPLTSPDGSRSRNTPERCPRPLYSRDSTQEHQQIHQEDQEDPQNHQKIAEEHEIPQDHQEIPQEHHELLQDHQEISQDHEVEGLTLIKVEDNEELIMEGDEPCKEEEVPHEISMDEQHIRNYIKEVPSKHFQSSTLEGNLSTPDFHPARPIDYLSSDPSTHGWSFPNPLHTIAVEKLPCYICGNFYSRNETLTVHHRSYTEGKPCSVCGKCFLQKLCSINEEITSSRDKPYSCSECDKSFSLKSSLRSHLQVHIEVKPYSCSHCGKIFKSNATLIQHMKIHSTEKPYSCTECGKSFTRSSSLYYHTRTHTGERPHSCSECGRCFARRTALVKHQRTHTGEKPYPCSECGKCFTRSTGLINHKKLHNGERPYSCSECGRSFVDFKGLATHKRIHGGVKPYVCSECGKSFAAQKSLSYHMKTHTMKGPFSSSESEKCFAESSMYDNHMEIHSGEDPFSCS